MKTQAEELQSLLNFAFAELQDCQAGLSRYVEQSGDSTGSMAARLRSVRMSVKSIERGMRKIGMEVPAREPFQ